MTRDVKVIVNGTGIHLAFENADCEFVDRLTIGQTRRLNEVKPCRICSSTIEAGGQA